MTEEEKKLAEAKALAEAEAKKGENNGAVIEPGPLKAMEEENAKLREERDNYKNVALKRLGKLPADSEFLGETGKEISSLIEDKVKEVLLEREIGSKEREKEELFRKTLKENAELRLLAKNRPGGSIGSEGGTVLEVKDNVFSPEQIAKLKETALKIKADPDKFVEQAKKNFQNRR